VLFKHAQESGPLLGSTVARTRTPNIMRRKTDGVDALASHDALAPVSTL
jgi:hypothetical protein